MFRLVTLSQSPEQVVLAVYGWIAAGNVTLLEQELESWEKWIGRLVLDLEGVRFIDEAGADMLRRWKDRDAVLRGGSPFLRALLEEYDLV
jgi:anti-anti-sigma regulatory factor